MFKLCWMNAGKKKMKKYKSLDKIYSLMTECIHSGEWIEDAKGDRLDIPLGDMCAQNLTLF